MWALFFSLNSSRIFSTGIFFRELLKDSDKIRLKNVEYKKIMFDSCVDRLSMQFLLCKSKTQLDCVLTYKCQFWFALDRLKIMEEGQIQRAFRTIELAPTHIKICALKSQYWCWSLGSLDINYLLFRINNVYKLATSSCSLWFTHTIVFIIDTITIGLRNAKYNWYIANAVPTYSLVVWLVGWLIGDCDVSPYRCWLLIQILVKDVPIK